jgi:predicted short-subunit dehydrogenase-like oxidoreductase (DUF2520 family)
MDIVIIGSGNVATVLGRKMIAAGHRIVQVAGRSPSRTHLLASWLEASSTTDMKKLNRKAGMYLLAIPDDALRSVAEWLHTGDAITVHTSGAVGINVLHKISSRYGIFYPLQSLRTDVTSLPEIPLLIDGNTQETMDLIKDFAHSISTMVIHAGDDYRKKIHLAAVLTGNFSNHLFTLAAEYCKRESLDFSLLLPLLKETVGRLALYPVEDMQTGPARRNDNSTIDNHLQMLEAYPSIKKIYALMTESIRDHYQ